MNIYLYLPNVKQQTTAIVNTRAVIPCIVTFNQLSINPLKYIIYYWFGGTVSV